MPAGGTRMSKRYYDERGMLRTAHKSVPVDQFGRIAGVEYACRKCRTSGWFAATLKGIPVCDGCSKRMVQVALKRPPLLPWRALWDVVERPLRPVWALPGLAAVGFAVDAARIPSLALLVAAPAGGELARRVRQWQLTKAQTTKGRLEEDDPDGGKRLRAAIARQARLAGYTTGVALSWLSLAAALGTDPSTVAGRISLAMLGALWLVPAATWWKRHRDEANRPAPKEPEPKAEPEVDVSSLGDPDEAQTHRIWSTIVAVKPGQLVGLTADGHQVRAPRSGKLAETRLEDWHPVEGGWGATAVGPDGVYVGENFIGARGSIASAFRMKTSMITVIPDVDDENRALVLAQRTSPITDVVRWAGPDSIDTHKGTAPMAAYVDGSPAMYEIYRPGWGSPHDFLCGTTGSGKSETLSILLLIDRWAHFVDSAGVKRGLVADFLIDPQQGQSFGPFLDDLAAPVATSIEEATLMVLGFREEMLRRNRYLANIPWVDERGRKRKGRKWWNPLVDGPILTLNIDEAHEYLAFKTFVALVTSGARMYRKCGMRIRIATHTPLLTDLGGSMALRDMLTGGFVWVGRTANSLSGPTAFNGRLPVDPRTIEPVPGTAYILTGPAPKPMKARSAWEPDYYDWVRDEADNPIGYPAALPPETLAAFGPEYAGWAQSRREGDGLWVPSQSTEPARQEPNQTAVDAVLSALMAAPDPLSMDQIDGALRSTGASYSTRTVRDALKKLRDAGRAWSADGVHGVTDALREQADEQLREGVAA
jgi:hypothetical protein